MFARPCRVYRFVDMETLAPSIYDGVPADTGTDIFRLDSDAEIVEHGDMLRAFPETGANNNTMF